MSKRSELIIPVGVKPQAAILVLENEFLLCAHDADGEVAQKYIGPAALRQAFAAEPIDSGWIPEGVRRWGVCSKGAWMLRWHQPAMYSAWLPDRKRPVTVPMPALVFFGIGKAYYIWAMKGERFDVKGRLFEAPCANVNALGLICWGSNPHQDVAKGFDQMWRLFWEAPFSGDHEAGANRRMAELARQKAQRFPEEKLTPLSNRLFPNPATLEAVVERMTRRGESSWE
jgi:hypothetical protein